MNAQTAIRNAIEHRMINELSNSFMFLMSAYLSDFAFGTNDNVPSLIIFLFSRLMAHLIQSARQWDCI